HELHVISPESLTPICLLKTRYLGSKNPRLHMDEVLIALSATAASDDTARKVLEQLPRLAQCQAHSSVILSETDMKTFNRLGDRKSTRLNSSHVSISYAVFCLKKKKKQTIARTEQREKQ